MAERSSLIFTPPMNSIPKNDPQIVRVPLESTDFGARASALNSIDMNQNPFTVRNLPNGQ
jgi:hypothetical protein